MKVFEGNGKKRAIFFVLAVTSKSPAIGLLPYFLFRSFLKCPYALGKAGKSKYRNGRQKPPDSGAKVFKERVFYSLKSHVYEIIITVAAFLIAYKANVVSESHGLTTPQRVARACYSLFWYLYRTLVFSEPNIVYPLPNSEFSLWSTEFTASIIAFTLLTFCSVRAMLLRTGPSVEPFGILFSAYNHWLQYTLVMLPVMGLIQHGYCKYTLQPMQNIPTLSDLTKQTSIF